MHQEALTEPAKKLLPKFRNFTDFYLAGGTALAIQLGHRVSVDFDFFSFKEIDINLLQFVEQIYAEYPKNVLVNNKSELTLIIGETKITFLHYPFLLLYPLIEWEGIKLITLKEIAVMKAYTIGRRGTFKDYVDLYYILKSGVIIQDIMTDAEKKYEHAFNSRLFLEQLVYLDDISDTEIIFLKSRVSKQNIEDFFIDQIKQIKLA